MDKVTVIEERGKECKLNYNKNEGKLTITLAGFLKGGDGAKEFIDEYMNICRNLNKDDTILILDTTELKVFEQDFLSDLEELFKEYSTFKKVYAIKSKAALTNNQAQRVIRKLGMEDKFIAVDSFSDIK